MNNLMNFLASLRQRLKSRSRLKKNPLLPMTLLYLIALIEVNEVKGHISTNSAKEISETYPFTNGTCDVDVYNVFIETYRTQVIEGNSYKKGRSSGGGSNKNALFDILTKGTFIHPELNETKSFSDYWDQLCLTIDSNKIIDIYQFECRGDVPKGAWVRETSCHCGKSMNSIDINVPQPELPKGAGELKQYIMTIGLNRRLNREKDTGECLSGHLGHCNHTLEIPLKCAEGLICKHLMKKGKQFRNANTSAIYGICLPENSLHDGEEVLFISSENSAFSLLFTYGYVWALTFTGLLIINL